MDFQIGIDSRTCNQNWVFPPSFAIATIISFILQLEYMTIVELMSKISQYFPSFSIFSYGCKIHTISPAIEHDYNMLIRMVSLYLFFHNFFFLTTAKFLIKINFLDARERKTLIRFSSILWMFQGRISNTSFVKTMRIIALCSSVKFLLIGERTNSPLSLSLSYSVYIAVVVCSISVRLVYRVNESWFVSDVTLNCSIRIRNTHEYGKHTHRERKRDKVTQKSDSIRSKYICMCIRASIFHSGITLVVFIVGTCVHICPFALPRVPCEYHAVWPESVDTVWITHSTRVQTTPFTWVSMRCALCVPVDFIVCVHIERAQSVSAVVCI